MLVDQPEPARAQHPAAAFPRAGEVHAADPDGAGARVALPRQYPHQRGLPRTVRPVDHHPLPRRHVEGQAAQRGDVPVPGRVQVEQVAHLHRHDPTSPGRWGIRSRMAVPATPAATTSPAATPRASTAATQAGPVARRSGGTGAVPTAVTCTSAAVTRDSSSPTTRPAGTAPATTAAARLNRETRRVPGRTPSLSQANSSADSSRRSATTSRITARIATSTATSALTVSRLAAPRATGSPESRSCRAWRRSTDRRSNGAAESDRASCAALASGAHSHSSDTEPVPGSTPSSAPASARSSATTNRAPAVGNRGSTRTTRAVTVRSPPTTSCSTPSAAVAAVAGSASTGTGAGSAAPGRTTTWVPVNWNATVSADPVAVTCAPVDVQPAQDPAPPPPPPNRGTPRVSVPDSTATSAPPSPMWCWCRVA